MSLPKYIEEQIAETLPRCKTCNTVYVRIDTKVNQSILVGCKCGWDGSNPKEWKKKLE